MLLFLTVYRSFIEVDIAVVSVNSAFMQTIA